MSAQMFKGLNFTEHSSVVYLLATVCNQCCKVLRWIEHHARTCKSLTLEGCFEICTKMKVREREREREEEEEREREFHLVLWRT